MATRRALCLALRRHCRPASRLPRADSLIVLRPAFSRAFSSSDTGGGLHQLFSRSYSKKSRDRKAARGRSKQQEEEDEEDEEEEEEEAEAESIDVEEPKRSAKQQMDSAMEALTAEFAKLRTGRASQGMLDHVEVEVDGKNTGLAHVAAVSVANPQTLTVTPFDATMVKKVEAGIRLSPLNLNPVSADLTITVPIPKITKELTQSLCKVSSKAAEQSKKSIRRGRQLGMDHLKKISSSISKDEFKRYEKEIDDVTKQYVKAVDDALKKKETDIMSSA